MRRLIIIFTLFLYVGVSADDLKKYFQLAGDEFGVPAELLEAIAFVNTRWVHIEPEKLEPACNGKPPAYGIMGLHDDDWFGHSLVEGAKLIGVPVEVVKKDLYQNIRAAAALLAKLSKERGLKKGLQRLKIIKMSSQSSVEFLNQR
ncbi:hypothetical protein [Candidatus Kryptobacter tengchongensis]|uniref:Transglycosylase SLT domain-containing protein n=1 Tax=Kryptobacter tengchongensis TaxID=1643429 RepID=A0A656DBI5_KRYT1|nr:hypothetical protein [Candidatus Kryptobacter tengchongensis]CUT04440.1 hypothetical protein JGI24_01494 [Candidatus Kryptobacter tengchongensis]